MIKIILFFVSATFASSFYIKPFPEIVRGASSIVRGKVGKSEVQWTTLPDGSKHLFTYYEVEVSEGFKGDLRSGSPIRIRELGGAKDGVTLNVSGTANFDKGEEVVVMLGEANSEIDGAYPVLGMMMGKFNLEKGEDGKEALRGAALQSEHPGEKPAIISLDRLREIVRTQANELKSSPLPSPKMSLSSPVIGSDVKNTGERNEIYDENMPKTKGVTPFSRRLIVFALGLGGGLYWFLKSRKKKG